MYMFIIVIAVTGMFVTLINKFSWFMSYEQEGG